MQPKPASRLRALLGPEEEPRPASRLRALVEGVWEPDPADPKRERRALPGGGFEYRAKGGPAAAAPAPPADPRAALIAAKRAEVERIRAGGDVNPGGVQPEQPSTWDRVKRSANLVRGGMTEGADFLANLPETAARALVSPLKAVDDYQKEQARERSLQAQIDLDQKLGREQTPERLGQIAKALPPGPKPLPEPEGLSFYGLPEIVDETLQNAREERERLTEEMIDDLAVNSSPLDAALMAAYGPRFTGNLLDPTMLYGPLKGAAALERRAGAVAAEARPASRLRALLGEAEEVVPTPRPREISPDIAELAAKSLEIGPAPERAPRGRVPVAEILDLDPPEASVRTLTAVSPTGDEVGHLRYQKDPAGGFRVEWVETDARGSGVARQLYLEASKLEGPYRGSSLARTPEGEALVSRLRETDPDIFPAAGHPAPPEGVLDAPGLRPREAGPVASPEPPPLPAAAAPLTDDLPPGAGLRPREPEIGAQAGAGEAFSPAPRVEPPALPGMEPGPPPRPPMSTKGLETFQDDALREGMEKVGQESFDEIYAARGAPVPVSQWHDAAGLQKKLKLAPEDYLNAPAGHTFGSDELALGKHYLGAMKRDAQALEARIAAGQVEDVAAAQAELATQNRDVVRMFAKLQGQGSSENARAMRMLQEALDPQGLAETPKERLQLALLKHYGARNADEAAAIEARAVAKLRAQAARETRKAARAVTKEELSSEFGSLLGELDALTKRPRGMGGGPVPLDPELVAVIGKLAQNRIKAGVVAVEEVADAVYMAIRDKVDVSREQVKASIVEHALARPAGTSREARAEAAARRSIKQLEERIAAGGTPKAKAAPVTSSALERLRARQSELRKHLAALQGKGAADPAVRRLKAAESAAARRVKQLEEKLAAGSQMPKPGAPSPESARLSALRQKAADLKSQIEKDPRHSLVQRYRELLDDETVDMIAKLPDPMEDPDVLVSFLRQMEKPTFRDFRTTYWLNSILSGVKTAARNLAGNVAKLGTDQLMRVPGAAVEQFVVAPLQRRAPERLVRAELPAVAATFTGLPDGIRKFAFVMRNGYDPGRLVAELTGSAAKWHEGARLPLSPFLLSKKPLVRAVGVPITMPSRILEATDALFKTLAATSEGYAWATRKALQDGAPDIGARVAQLLAEQPDDMIKAQVLAAQKATYQDPMSWVGQTASAVRRGPPGADKLAQELKAKGGVGNRVLAAAVNAPATVGQHLVPFIHVSDRVAAAITDFIPGSKPFKTARLLAEKSPEAADLLARQAFGGALGLLGIAWASDGKLVGAAPKDEKLRNDFYAEGKQPYSLLIGDRWVPMRDTLGPLAGPFVAAAQYHDHIQVGEDPSAAVSGMALATADYMLDASYLQSLQDVVSAVQDQRGGAGRKLEAAAARMAGSYVPFSGLAGNVAQAMDPRVVEKEGFVDELRSRIPGLRQDLPARVGTLGNELRSATGLAGGFLPIVPTENQVADAALAEEVGRLRYTIEKRRTEISRAEAGIKDARKLKDREREAELLATIPRNPSDRAQADAALARVRGLEQQLRKLRASENAPEGQRRTREIALQKRMQDILSKALQRLGGTT